MQTHMVSEREVKKMAKAHDPIIDGGCLSVLEPPGRIRGRILTGSEEARFISSKAQRSVSSFIFIFKVLRAVTAPEGLSTLRED